MHYEFEDRKSIVLVIGVNGVGKTTSVGKLSAQIKGKGKKVIMAAADTFRAAAIEQLTEWAHRAGTDIIAQQEGSDPAAVIYDAIQAAKARKADVLICDTAGRLHNKKNLMAELKKIDRIIEKEYSEAYRENFIVLDATTGQNALAQAKQFMECADITGVILTKMDGTAKGVSLWQFNPNSESLSNILGLERKLRIYRNLMLTVLSMHCLIQNHQMNKNI